MNRNRRILVETQQRTRQGAAASVDINVVCPECGQTTRSTSDLGHDFGPVDTDGWQFVESCPWCQRNFLVVVQTEMIPNELSDSPL